MTNMKEKCAILIGKQYGRTWYGRLKKYVIGDTSSVKFDGDWVLEREEKKGDVIGFYHTHFSGVKPSERDIRTMHAWATCFGKSLVCIIKNRSDFAIWTFHPNELFHITSKFAYFLGFYLGKG